MHIYISTLFVALLIQKNTDKLILNFNKDHYTHHTNYTMHVCIQTIQLYCHSVKAQIIKFRYSTRPIIEKR
jgi:hypothetical protein